MNDKMKSFLEKFRILFNPWLQLAMRLVVGFLLIYFSIHKFQDPVQWAEVIYQYRLVPFSLVNFVSVALSWLEFFAGVGILTGFFTRAASLSGIGIVGIYLAALQINLWKEVYIYCGCFRKQAYITDVNNQNRNITFFVLILLIIIFLNRNPKIGLDSAIKRFRERKSDNQD